jgi:2-dehydropantoate 2-reductase
MKRIERVAIVGAGAVGASLASMIEDSLPGSATIIATGERLERYAREGFTVNGKHYRFPLSCPDRSVVPEPVPAPTGKTEALRGSACTRPFDLVIVAVKHHHLAKAIAAMSGAVGEESLVLSLMNGITSEDSLSEAFGREKVPYGMILGIDALREGTSVSFTKTGTIHFGEARNGPAPSPRVVRIAEFFERAQIPYSIPADMIRTLWYKFMVNCGINQASAALRAPYAFFHRNADARRVMEAGMREVIELSRSLGTGLTETDIGDWNAKIPGFSPTGKTSMLQDIEAGRKTEVEMLAGTVVELAARSGIPVPVNALWLDLIHALEAMSSMSARSGRA